MVKKLKVYSLKQVIPVILFLIMPVITLGQTGKLFTIDSDLSSSMVMDVYQDRSGYIWIATEDGLNKYDGLKFTTYRQHAHQKHSILNNNVRSIFEDSSGRMYVGYINGLQYYDPARDEFHTIPLVDNSVLLDRNVKSICQRKGGRLLVGTSGYGIFEVLQGRDGWFGRQLTDVIPSDMIVNIFEDTKGVLWISTEDRGLFRLDGGNQTNYFASKEFQNNVISSICQDKYGTLWVGSMNNGLFKYDAAVDTFCQIPYRGETSLPILDLIVTAKNDIYIATDGHGMKYVDKSLGEIVDLKLAFATFSFEKSKLNTVLEDRDGNIWMGVYHKGVFLLPNHKNSFGYIGYKSVNENLIGSNSVTAVFEDNQGVIWVGTDNDGIYGVDPSQKKAKHYVGTANGNHVPATVMAIFEDSKRDVWVGSHLDGLAKFDRKSDEFSYPVALVDKKNGAKVQRVYDIVEDSRKRLWIATMGSGLFQMDINNHQVKQYDVKEKSKFKPQSNHIPNNWVSCMLMGRNNKLYFGTVDGLGCLDLETENFVSTFGTNRLFGDEIINSLYDDQLGNLWIGTSRGLKRLEMATKKVSEFGMENGLASHVIWSIAGDSWGNIWVSTNHGIAKFDAEQERFLNFYASDGLQGEEFLPGVSMMGKNGQLFFGGLHGINYFNPSEIQIQHRKLAVHVVGFYTYDGAVKKGMKSGRYDIVDTTVNHAKLFQLAYLNNSFTIEFSTMDFSDSERVIFQYSLNGNEWMALPPSSNRITFENLESGTYKLRVRAATSNVTSETKEVGIIIHPVWFLSTTAKLIYVLVALLSGLVVFRIVKNRRRIRKQMLAHQRAEEISEAKLQFFINIAHEIRTPLTLIASPLNRLMDECEENDRIQSYRVMERNVHRILDLVNQLMDIRKIEKGQMVLHYTQVDLVRYIREVCDLFEEQIRNKDIRFTLKCAYETRFAHIDPRNFDKVLVNVLSNACKFTPIGGWIEVEFNVQADNMAVISVADSGQQIDEQEADRIFECFYQSDRHRDYNGSGTGIGLYLAKQLMELHGGTISARNLVDGGCRFLMAFPVAVSQEIPVTADVPFSAVAKRKLPMPVCDESPTSRKRKSKRILIADDDHDILEYLRGALSDRYSVVTFSDGEEAYQNILTTSPDLIMTDVMMPKLDGFSLCAKVRGNPNVNAIPIVLLTAKTGENDNLHGLGCGADAYVTKPFYMEILLKTIETIIRNRELIKNGEREQYLQDEHISKVSLKSMDEKLLEKVHRIIESNLDNPLLSVEMISSEVGISRVHLHRKLKELTNLTTRDLIRSIRLKQAAELMANKGLSVSEVAFAVGYSDLSSFSVSFKQLYGVSPTAYIANETLRTQHAELD